MFPFHDERQAGESSPINIVTQTVVIAGDDYIYTAQRRLRWLWTKEAVLILNTPVKFAVEKQKLLLVDDDGDQYELEIVKTAKH